MRGTLKLKRGDRGWKFRSSSRHRPLRLPRLKRRPFHRPVPVPDQTGGVCPDKRPPHHWVCLYETSTLVFVGPGSLRDSGAFTPVRVDDVRAVAGRRVDFHLFGFLRPSPTRETLHGASVCKEVCLSVPGRVGSSRVGEKMSRPTVWERSLPGEVGGPVLPPQC